MNSSRKRNHARFAFLCCLAFSTCQSLMTVTLPFIAGDLNLSISQVIFVFGTGSFLFLFSNLFWISISDLIGRIKVIQIGLTGLLISLLFMVCGINAGLNGHSGLAYLWASRIVYGLTAGSIVIVSQSVFAESTFRSTIAGLSQHAQATAIGRCVGPVISLCALKVELKTVILLLSILVMTLAFSAFKVKDDPKKKRALKKKFWIKKNDIQGLSNMILSILLLAMITAATQSILTESYIIQLQDKNNAAFLSSIVYVLGNLAMIGHQLYLMRSSQEKVNFYSSILLFSSLVVLLISSNVWVMSIGFILFFFSIAGLRVGILSSSINLSQGSASSPIAAFSFFQTIGYAGGNLLASSLSTVSIEYLYTSTVFFSLCIMFNYSRERVIYGRLNESRYTT